MKGIRTLLAMVAVGVAAVLLGASQLLASDQGGRATQLVPLEPDAHHTLVTQLKGFEEVPAISTNGSGFFNANISSNDSQIDWTLNYNMLQGNVTQAHLHIAQRGVNGGIMIFLCTNLGNGPAGTPLCPSSPGNLSGSANASSIGSGASNQGIAPGEFAEVLRAIRAGVVYANVHTDLFPGGEIRGQLMFVDVIPNLTDGPRTPPAPAIPGPAAPAGTDGVRGPGG